SRQAKHGCFARESGQDALTERRVIPGRQGTASNSKAARDLQQPCPPSASVGRRTFLCSGAESVVAGVPYAPVLTDGAKLPARRSAAGAHSSRAAVPRKR